MSCAFIFCCVVASDWDSSSVDAAGVWPLSCCEAVRDGRQCMDEEGQDDNVIESAEDDASFNQGQLLYCTPTDERNLGDSVLWSNLNVNLRQQDVPIIIALVLYIYKKNSTNVAHWWWMLFTWSVVDLLGDCAICLFVCDAVHFGTCDRCRGWKLYHYVPSCSFGFIDHVMHRCPFFQFVNGAL